ncbi:hypothetical protein [Roseivirga sp. UBA838]|nr:hypothetical protein [Roseivirga sp. UBA838]
MNRIRRKELAEICAALTELAERLQVVRDEEEEAFDNMPESMQYTDRGERMQENVSTIDESISEIEDKVSELQEL